MEKLTTFFLCFAVLTPFLITCAAVDTISATQTLTDGDTIVSSGENFEMGFFSPGTSTNRYLGIWYKKVSNLTVVWVANTETPLNNSSGLFRLSQQGALEILTGNNSVIWSSNSSASGTSGVVAQLRDTGNLVLTNQGSVIWQSFDYPGDTLLSGMRIGVDLITGKERYLTSWKSADDPSAGEFVFRVDRNGFPQLFERRVGVPVSRFGPWNGEKFNGMPSLGGNSIFTEQFVFNENEIYYEYTLMNNSLVSRMHLSTDGKIEHLNWINRTRIWNVYSSTAEIDACARYAICGPYGSCNIDDSPACSCLKGFEPQVPQLWNQSDWSSGCQRKTSLACGDGVGFRRLSGVKLPDTNTSLYNLNMTIGECEAACKRNCSCTAYASLDIRSGGIGCLQWFNDLMDIRVYDEAQELHIKMPASESDPSSDPTATKHGSNKKQTITIGVSIALGLVLFCLILALYVAWRKKKRSRSTRQVSMQAREENYTNQSRNKDTELTSFSLSRISRSTDDFAFNNKLGEGGFGPVYKGVLEDGREIAVKRLSATSRQGLDEFKNEVGCIAKLQHRNLVKLLGYCIHGDERMLIYEYMENKSLDFFIFDASRSIMLDWPLRFRIINGIARGLLYLHQDSRLRIIHRDLKAGNILLDRDMNPKISDFGLARRFSGYETEANTNKVVGTYGYISPEYAVHGLFSTKSDVYSFGVLVLETVSGKKNRGFSQDEHHDTLIGHAWKLHKEGKSLELVSGSLRQSCVASQVLRAVHIGLLCVQHHAEDRPTMSQVVLMLGNENFMPPPKQPAFFAEENFPEPNSMSSAPTVDSVDAVTITLLDAR